MRKVRVGLIFIIFMTIIMVMSGCTSSGQNDLDGYEIVIDDKINIYAGKDNTISPYLIDKDGTVVDSRFDFTPSCNDIIISYDGKITIHNIPPEDITVLITERNTGIQKTIRLVFIIEELSKVTAISGTDGKPVSEINNFKTGENITLNVITNLGTSMTIEPYCSINAVDDQGNNKKIFEPSYSNNQITLHAVGFGKGTLSIEIKNASGEKLYDFSVPFSIELQDAGLFNRILEDNKASAVGKDDLQSISIVRVDDTIHDLTELSLLENLKTVVVEPNQLVAFKGSAASYYYRVPAKLYEMYYTSAEWSELKERLIPFVNSLDERYVIYHSDKVKELSYELIDGDFSLQTLSLAGYTNIGWKDKANNLVSNDSIKNSSDSCIHLFAEWVANSNRIVFNGNGATSGSMEDQLISTNESATLNHNRFVKDGYTFAGWATSANGTMAYNDGATFQMNTEAEHHLYALWVPTENSVVFNANGGEGNMSPIQTATDTTVTLTKNQFTRKGYTFSGWSTTPNGAVEYNDETEYEMGSTSSNTLYAVWSIIKYAITYELDGGTAENPIEYTIETDTFVLSSPQKKGYEFIGWVDSASGGYKMTITIHKGSVGNLNYVAGWKGKSNRIVFHSNGGEGTMEPQIIASGTSELLSENLFTKYGYDFVGWSSEPNGIVSYSDGATFEMGIESEYNLYAMWSVSNYTISYDLNGGTLVDNATSYTVYSNSFEISSPTRVGYTFVGWSGSDIDGIKKNVTVENGSVGNRSFVAHWEAKTNQVFFDSNGAQGTMNGFTGKTDQYINLPSNSFYRSGYSFSGWSETKDGEVIYAECSQYQITALETTTLYACWSPLYQVALQEDNTYHITKYIGTESKVEIPLSIDGISVNGISANAFSECITVESVFISKNVTYIGAGLFSGCVELTKIEVDSSNPTYYSKNNCIIEKENKILVAGCNTSIIPTSDNVLEIGKNAFKGCTKLAQIIVPDTVLKIGSGAFSNCWGLINVSLSQSITTIESNTFTNCHKLVFIEIPDNVTKISAYAFYECGLAKVVLPEKLESLEYDSFYRCFKIIEIYNNSNFAITIGSDTFGYLTSNTKNIYSDWNSNFMTKSSKFIIVDDYWFYNDQGDYYLMGYSGSETKITLPDAVNGSQYSIGAFAFYKDYYLEEVIMPDNIIRIGNYAFTDCISIKKMTIGKNVSEISAGILSGCSSLVELTFPYVESSDSNFGALFGKSNYEGSVAVRGYYNAQNTYYIPSSLTIVRVTKGVIPRFAFNGCTMIREIEIGADVEEISENVFRECWGIKTLTIAENIDNIEMDAFSGCEGVENLTISANILSYIPSRNLKKVVLIGGTEIPNGAFLWSDNLESIEISSSITRIGEDAFFRCPKLKSVVIPSSVKYIGEGAFDYCTSLTSVTFASTSGWKVYGSNGTFSINSSNLKDKTNAAKYLRETYTDYYWERS